MRSRYTENNLIKILYTTLSYKEKVFKEPVAKILCLPKIFLEFYIILWKRQGMFETYLVCDVWHNLITFQYEIKRLVKDTGNKKEFLWTKEDIKD